MKRTASLVKFILRLGLLLATTVSFGRSHTATGLLPGDSPSGAYGIVECGQVVDAPRAGIPPKVFLVVIPEDIEKLWQVAMERGERPSHEGHLFLEFKSGGFRQYVTLTLAQGQFGGFAGIERIDFIQEQWQANVLGQDEIDQWVVAADASGRALHVWHKRLLEDRGTVLKEEFLPTDEDSAKAIVDTIAAQFLTPLLSATAIMPNADRSRKRAADAWLAGWNPS